MVGNICSGYLGGGVKNHVFCTWGATTKYLLTKVSITASFDTILA